MPSETDLEPDKSLKSEVLAAHQILTVTSFEALQRRTVQGSLRVMYLPHAALGQLSDTWLRQQYDAEVATVALNTLVSELAAKLGIAAPMEDLRPALTQKYPFFVVFHKASAPHPGTATSQGVTADFVGSTDDIPLIINHAVDAYHLTPEFGNTLKDTCLK